MIVPYDSAANGYQQEWEQVFSSRAWGRYPPESLVRFMARGFGSVEDKSGVKVLEVGCGPGANIWYLVREGYRVAGLDCSPTAIAQAMQRLQADKLERPDCPSDLRTGDFTALPWDSDSFDVVLDINAICSAPRDMITAAHNEARRVLKPGGVFFSKMFGTETTGYDPEKEIEPGTMRKPGAGACAGAPLVHYFTRAEVDGLMSIFAEVKIDWMRRSDHDGSAMVEEWLVAARK